MTTDSDSPTTEALVARLDEMAATLLNRMSGLYLGSTYDRQWAIDVRVFLREFERDRKARNAIDPTTRLHNLCDHLAEQRGESPYDAESWRIADEDNQELRRKLAAAERELAELRAQQPPREPTPEMIRVAEVMAQQHDNRGSWIRKFWLAMYDAAIPPRSAEG